MNITNIIEESSKARQVFDRHYRQLGSSFNSFPEGACGNASDFLSEWLITKNLGVFEYVWGTRKGFSHGWLEIDGYIIDITGDQFSDFNDPVYIGTDKEFHGTFEEQQRSAPEVSPYLSHELEIFIDYMENA